MKHVTWNDIVKLGTMNQIVQKNLDELGEMPGITHAYALMAMVDELDGQLERYKLDALRYRYLRDPQVRPRTLDVADNFMSVYDGEDLDQAIDEELAKPGVRESLGAEWFVQRVDKLAALSREQVLATLRGAGFVDAAANLEGLLDDIASGSTGNKPAPDPAAEWRAIVARVLTVLDMATGDTDPNIAPDMTDDEVCAEYPEIWACQQLSGLLTAMQAVAKNDHISGEKVASDKAEG